MSNAVIILAAGQSSRFKSNIPKQYLKINGKSILSLSLEVFLSIEDIQTVIVVVNPSHMKYYTCLTKRGYQKCVLVIGGDTRQQSVWLALQKLKKLMPPKKVLVHDAARPHISSILIKKVLKELDNCNAVDIILPIVDSIKSYSDHNIPVNKTSLYTSQTPQGFNFQKIYSLHNKAALTKDSFNDDISLFIKYEEKFNYIYGDHENIKITFQSDIEYFKRIQSMKLITKTGIGFDIHKLSKPIPQNINIRLGGIDIEYNQKIIAHSDGDVVIHAITDAILGAIGLGDIGHFFPSTNKEYRDMNSKKFLLYAMQQLRKIHGKIINIDTIIVCEKIIISQYSIQMKHVLCDIMKISNSCINIKASTAQGLGLIGQSKAIAVQTVCNIMTPYTND